MLRRIKSARLLGGRTKPVHVLLSAVAVAMLATPLAFAQGSNGSAPSYVRADSDWYAFVARNHRVGDGGAATMACNSNNGPTNEPCLNMFNSGTGYAAAFRTRGLTGFRLQTSGAGEATPFLLDPNATGLVKYLNADKVDGLSADQIGREQFARVNVAAGTGAPTLVRGNGTISDNAVARVGVGDYRVEFTQDVSRCVYQVTSADTGSARQVAAAEDSSNPRRVAVSVRDGSGAGIGNPIDGPFSLTVNC
jgi:hypothetical protein